MSRDERQTYAGFPNRVRRVPVPAPLLGSLLERIDDLAELKCTLRVVGLLSEKRGYPRFVTLGELQADRSLALAVSPDGSLAAAEQIEQALGRAVKRGTLAFAMVGSGKSRQPIFGLNTESDRSALSAISKEGARPHQMDTAPAQPPTERLNIFALYEQNIGLLSPMIADELREAEGLYPEDWVEDAIKEAVTRNKRSWRYVATILDRWEREGRGYGESGQYPKKTARF